jgi:hypothetical protein
MLERWKQRPLESGLFIRRISCLYNEGIPAVGYLFNLNLLHISTLSVEDSTFTSFTPFITAYC